MTNNKILIVDDEEDIREILRFVIEGHFTMEILEASSGEQALQVLEENMQHIGLILCDYRMENGNGDIVYQFIKERGNKIPFYFVTTHLPTGNDYVENFQSDAPHNGLVNKPFKMNELIDIIEKDYIQSFINEDSKVEKEPHQGFGRIRATKFIDIETDCEVHIELSSGKYVKIRNKGDTTTSQIVKYCEKGVEFLYIQEEDFGQFLEKQIETVFERLNHCEAPAEERNRLQIDALSSVHNCLKNLHIAKKAKEAVEKAVTSSINTIKKNNDLAQLLDCLKGKDDYIYEHALLTGYVSCTIAEYMDWKSEGIKQKLTFASLFHNLDLDSVDEARVYSLESDEFHGLDRNSQKRVRSHMLDAVNKLLDAPGFTEDAKKAILAHHEKPDGSGFPRGLSATQVGPFEALFILSVHFSHLLIEAMEDQDKIHSAVQDILENYSSGNFKRPLQAFEKAFKKLITQEVE